VIKKERSNFFCFGVKRSRQTQEDINGGAIMGKEQNTKKEAKKEPAKSMKEKKAAKKAKKEDKKGQMP
jgi:hypothetical protein